MFVGYVHQDDKIRRKSWACSLNFPMIFRARRLIILASASIFDFHLLSILSLVIIIAICFCYLKIERFILILFDISIIQLMQTFNGLPLVFKSYVILLLSLYSWVWKVGIIVLDDYIVIVFGWFSASLLYQWNIIIVNIFQRWKLQCNFNIFILKLNIILFNQIIFLQLFISQLQIFLLVFIILITDNWFSLNHRLLWS